MNPDTGRFEHIHPELAAKFADQSAILTPQERKMREWTQFQEGEEVTLKGITFRVHEIGETRLVLKPIKK